MTAGAILLVVAVLGGFAAFALLARQMDVGELQRDVVTSGERTAPIPGELRFSVDRPLDGRSGDSMTVAIAVPEGASSTPTCSMRDSGGAAVTLTTPPYGATLLNGDGSRRIISEVELRPGDYVAACTWSGEPSKAPSANRFTVGRTLGGGDLRTLVGPLLGMLAVASVAAVMFIVGLILLVVGLVRRSRSGGGSGSPVVTWPVPTTPVATPVPSEVPAPVHPEPTTPPGGWTVPERYTPTPPTVPVPPSDLPEEQVERPSEEDRPV